MWTTMPATKIRPHTGDRDRGIDAGLLDEPRVERHAAEPRGRELGRRLPTRPARGERLHRRRPLVHRAHHRGRAASTKVLAVIIMIGTNQAHWTSPTWSVLLPTSTPNCGLREYVARPSVATVKILRRLKRLELREGRGAPRRRASLDFGAQLVEELPVVLRGRRVWAPASASGAAAVAQRPTAPRAKHPDRGVHRAVSARSRPRATSSWARSVASARCSRLPRRIRSRSATAGPSASTMAFAAQISVGDPVLAHDEYLHPQLHDECLGELVVVEAVEPGAFDELVHESIDSPPDAGDGLYARGAHAGITGQQGDEGLVLDRALQAEERTLIADAFLSRT